MTATSAWYRRWLASPRLPLALAAVAAVLTSPSLGAGLATEDWVLRANALGPFSLASVNLWAGMRSSAEVALGHASGALPWVTSPDFRLSFWRPLSSLWVHFDFRILGDALWLMHLESILLFSSLVYLVARLYARLVPASWAAGLAAVVFAIDDAHGHAVGWLANRNALLSGVFGVAALLAHDRWRRDGDRRGAWLAPGFLALSLASGELGLCGLGFFLAHTVFIDRAPRRVLAFAPSFSVVVAWAVAHRTLGHGTRGSGIYVDPLTSPVEFVTELPTRLGALVLGQLAVPRADSWVTLGDARHWALALGGLAALLPLLFVLWPALAKSDPRAPVLRFSLAGMLLSALPVAATSPSDRTLLFPGMGGALAVGLALGLAVEQASAARRALALGLGVVHLLIAPVCLPVRVLAMSRYHDRAVSGARSAYANVISGDDLVVALSAPDYYFCSLLRVVRQNTERGPAPPVVCLGATRGRVEVERVDQNALSVFVADGFLSEPFNRIFHSRRDPLPVGTRVYRGSFEALVTETRPSGEPTRVTFRFNWPLESEKLRFVAWKNGGFVPVPAPRVGERVEIPATAGVE